MSVLACLAIFSCPVGSVPPLPLPPPYRGGRSAVVPRARGGQARIVLRPVEHLAQWTCIHRKEGAWNDNTGNGYHGGLQMDWGFMRTYGSDMLRIHHGVGAESWTPREQMIVAERAYDAGRGFYPWPNTARACGYI